MLDALAEKAEYRSRITIIVFGLREDGDVVGRHWLSYAGDRQGHRRSDFDPAAPIILRSMLRGCKPRDSAKSMINPPSPGLRA